MGIHLKNLSKLGFKDNVARSLIVDVVRKHYKHHSEEEIKTVLNDILINPEVYKNNEVWSKLAERLSPSLKTSHFSAFNLLKEPQSFKIYGKQFIEPIAIQQMELAMRLPITLNGALMPDAHAGYGLPIGGVLATDNAVIPYAVGVDIGCSMNLTIFDAKADFLNRYSYQIKEALKTYTHFGMDGGLGFPQEHEVLDREEFRLTPLLKDLQSKAVRQLGTSGGGNHFVEFGELVLEANNVMNLPKGSYTALLSHSGSRGMGAAIAQKYSSTAREVCKLPREAQHFAWLDLATEAGQEYWLSMNLAGDYAKACHEQIHKHLSKALGIHPLGNIGNHHNFAWKEKIHSGKTVIIHRKGATPAGNGQPGLIPGSMATPGYLVTGKGVGDSLCSASHGAGRAMSRQKAKESFTLSSQKKILSQAGVTLLGGSIEEMPLAYKDINRVMQTQEMLVEIEGIFMPRIVRMNKE